MQCFICIYSRNETKGHTTTHKLREATTTTTKYEEAVAAARRVQFCGPALLPAWKLHVNIHRKTHKRGQEKWS